MNTEGQFVSHPEMHDKARREQGTPQALPYPLSVRKALLAGAVKVLGNLRAEILARAAKDVGTRPFPVLNAESAFTQTEEEYWLSNEGLTSERRFHDRLTYLVKLLKAAYTQNDVDGLSDAFRRLLWVDQHITGEPLLSEYDTGLALGLLNIGLASADRYMIEDGYTIAEGTTQLLDIKRERRSMLSLPPRPDSECWYRLYALLAELKWKGPSEMLDRLMGPSELILEFTRVEQRCLDYIERTPASDPLRNATVRESLAWCRLELIKMAIQWCHEQTDAVISRFNQVHGTELSAEPGLFTKHKPTGQEDPWYWDLELYKWCVCGPASVEEAMMCHHWRVVAARSRFPRGAKVDAYEMATLSELKHLLSRAGKELPEPI